MRVNTLRYVFLMTIYAAVFAGCTKEYEGIEVQDEQDIQAYIRSNNLNMQEYDTTGIYYQVLEPGSGEQVDYTEIIPLVYSTKAINNSYSALDTFSISQRYGVNGQYLGYFKPDGLRTIVKEVLKFKGGRIRVIVPSRKAYGQEGSDVLNIPGNSSLEYIVSVIDTTTIKAYDDASIQQYLRANNLSGFTKTASGLYYKIAVPGSGSSITADSTISAEYTGKFFNGEIFEQSSSGQPITRIVSGFILGWQEGLPLIKKGGSIRLIIPSKLAYGPFGSVNQGIINIPPVSCLDFDIKVAIN